MAEWALVKDGVVVNVIVADQDFIDQFAQEQGDVAVSMDGLDPLPGIGWSYDGTTLLPPEPTPTLSSAPASIPPDGTTAATVTYTNQRSDAPVSVDFSVNGQTSTVAMANGIATVQVASATPSDTITVTCEGLTTTVAVTA